MAGLSWSYWKTLRCSWKTQSEPRPQVKKPLGFRFEAYEPSWTLSLLLVKVHCIEPMPWNYEDHWNWPLPWRMEVAGPRKKHHATSPPSLGPGALNSVSCLVTLTGGEAQMLHKVWSLHLLNCTKKFPLFLLIWKYLTVFANLTWIDFESYRDKCFLWKTKVSNDDSARRICSGPFCIHHFH